MQTNTQTVICVSLTVKQ